jgi:plasmid stabilization system protein ParE
MGDIKSAREIAMEKLEKLGEATEEERLKWKLEPKGQELAARYLKEDCNLVAELSKYQENEREYVAAAAAEVLVRNVELPRNEAIRRTNKKAMDGLKLVKNDKASVENAHSRIRQIFSHYTEQGEQQRRQAYEQLRAQFEARVQQAIQQQLGTAARMRVDVERQPQFQEEWRRLQIQLEAPYLEHLREYRQEILSID